MSDSDLRPGGDVGIFLLGPVNLLDLVWTLCGPCVDPIINRTLFCVIFIHFRLKHL